MQLLEPGYLLLLPLLLGVVWWSRRHLLGMSRTRKLFVLVLRSLVVILLVMALAGPQAVQSNRGVCTVFAVDLSDSISDAGRERAKTYLKEAFAKLGPHDQAALVVFGQDSLVEFLPTATPKLHTIQSVPNSEGTDIASAIRLASALFPDGKNRRIVLLTDGNETQGSALDAASVASVQDIEIDGVSLAPNTPTSETLLAETFAPDEVRVGEPFNLEVVVEARKPAEGTLIVDRDGVPVKRVKVTLTPGKNRISIPIRTESEGFHRYQVQLEAVPDEDVRNNVGRAFVRVQGKPRVLLASGGKTDPNQSLLRALRANNLEVVAVNESTFPARADALQAYDAIILNDFPADALSPRMMLSLQSAVRDTGIGFAMIGGENSFLPGGYYDTPIAEMLPVDLDVRQRKVFPPATVVVIIDISGSMAMIEDGMP
ncbi:MAG: VWA domain-containing protein, partial [Fimbriimonadales bacterium]